jgi:hypothetical protein
MNDRDLMRARTDALFIYNDAGRMVRVNSPDREQAPHVYLAYTSGAYVIRFGCNVSDLIAARLQELVDAQPHVETIRTAPPAVAAIGHLLGQQAADREGGPTYRFPDGLTLADTVVQITEETVDLARTTFPWLLTELAGWAPCFAVVRDGAAVSLCFSSRIGAAVCEAGVITLPAFRGRGYATDTTAAWARAIQDAGRVPVYSTSWSNLASQGVARHLGLMLFGADAVWP